MAEAQLSGLINSLSGTLGNFVFRTTNNGIVVSDRPRRRNDKPTKEQLLARAWFAAASRGWQTITDAQRVAWSQYATAYFPKDKDGVGAGPSGQAVYIKAAWYQQAAGQALPSDSPADAPPPSPTGFLAAVVTSSDLIGFGLIHPIAIPAGYRVFIEATPPILSPARSPLPGEHRAVAGLGADSFETLMTSGGSYEMGPVRYPVESGERFGVRTTIVNPGGVPSVPFEAILVQTIL